MTSHGHRSPRTPTYHSWNAMIQRCTNSLRHDYQWYGGLGVTVDPRWRRFKNFLDDVGIRPEGATLDRIDPTGNYCPGNVKWSTPTEQNNNQRKHFYAGQKVGQ